jgi:hypothetical protein
MLPAGFASTLADVTSTAASKLYTGTNETSACRGTE